MAGPLKKEEINKDVAEFISNDYFVLTSNENWQLVPDTNGHMHLIDVNRVDLNISQQANAWTDVIFYLYTRKNINEGQRVDLNNLDQLRASNFNAAHSTR